MMKNDIQEVLFSEQQLADKVAELGARISADYAGKDPLIVSVLKGSYVFMADLTRRISIPCNVDFMAVSSYGAGTKTTGEVQIIKGHRQQDRRPPSDHRRGHPGLRRNAELPDEGPQGARRGFHPPVHAAV